MVGADRAICMQLLSSGMLLSPKRLITYVYPLLLDTIVHIYILNQL